MAMKSCKECGKDVAKSAPTCPHCGVKNPGRKKEGIGWGPGCLIIIVVILVGGLFIDTEPPTRTGRPIGAVSRATSGVTRYAHRNINVRAGRGTSFEVVGQISRGQSVQVDSLVDGWYRVLGTAGSRYAAASVLESRPLPALEIVDWNWRKDQGFGIGGAIIYQGRVRNNSTIPIRNAQVTITIYDADGNFLDTDFTYTDGGMAPGAVTTFKSYAEYWPTAGRVSIRVER